jgi:SH3-like domain-containing protein
MNVKAITLVTVGCMVAILVSSCTKQPTATNNNPSPAPASSTSSPSSQVSPAQTPSSETASKAASKTAAAPSAQNVPCELSAYVIDKDPKGLNVRSEPGSNGKIIGNLPTQNEGVMVDITACQGEWVQITNAISDGGGKVEFQGKGWVSAPLLGTATKGNETNGTSLYAQADKNSKILSKLPPNRTVKLLGGSGTWIQVEYEGKRGWLAQYDYCSNPWTSCS